MNDKICAGIDSSFGADANPTPTTRPSGRYSVAHLLPDSKYKVINHGTSADRNSSPRNCTAKTQEAVLHSFGTVSVR